MSGFSLKIILLFLSIMGITTSGYVYYSTIYSPNNGTFQLGSADDGGIHGAPGPLAGAGLPVLGIAYGFYRLVRRRRKAG